eukprot:1667463-Pyramimonas_sp.AAC.1
MANWQSQVGLLRPSAAPRARRESAWMVVTHLGCTCTSQNKHRISTRHSVVVLVLPDGKISMAL